MPYAGACGPPLRHWCSSFVIDRGGFLNMWFGTFGHSKMNTLRIGRSSWQSLIWQRTNILPIYRPLRIPNRKTSKVLAVFVNFHYSLSRENGTPRKPASYTVRWNLFASTCLAQVEGLYYCMDVGWWLLFHASIVLTRSCSFELHCCLFDSEISCALAKGKVLSSVCRADCL